MDGAPSSGFNIEIQSDNKIGIHNVDRLKEASKPTIFAIGSFYFLDGS